MLVVGCDLVSLARFKKKLTLGGPALLARIFEPQELANEDPQSLASIFAAKEAAMKALGLAPGSWLKMAVEYHSDGKPILKFAKEITSKIKTADLSISHEGNLTIAVFVAWIK